MCVLCIVYLIGYKSILISLFLVASGKEKELYRGFIGMMLNKHKELILLDSDKNSRF